MVQNITIWKIRRARIFAALTHADLSNAFGSTVWEALDDCVNERLVDGADSDFMQQRFRCAAIEVKGASGLFSMRPAGWGPDG